MVSKVSPDICENGSYTVIKERYVQYENIRAEHYLLLVFVI
jgi:hypothetical protein